MVMLCDAEHPENYKMNKKESNAYAYILFPKMQFEMNWRTHKMFLLESCLEISLFSRDDCT